MNAITGFITVRTTSKRLPKKCLLPFGEINVLRHIIRRCKYYQITPIVCTTDNKMDDVLVDIAKGESVKFFRGSEINKLKRWNDCCQLHSVEKFHTIDADDPFFDGLLVKKSLSMLASGYDVIEPTLQSSSGGASVGYSLTSAIVEQVCGNIPEGTDTEMMWFYLDRVANIKKIKLEETVSNIPENLRLTLDYEEDYWLLESIRRILGNNVERDEIYNFFRNNPDFHKINWFRNQQWKEGQLAKQL